MWELGPDSETAQKIQLLHLIVSAIQNSACEYDGGGLCSLQSLDVHCRHRKMQVLAMAVLGVEHARDATSVDSVTQLLHTTEAVCKGHTA